MFFRLWENNIDVILRENYRSVLAAEGMKEAARADGTRPSLFAIGGEEEQAFASSSQEFRPLEFEQNFKVERGTT